MCAKRDPKTLTIDEAVETLNEIVEHDFDVWEAAYLDLEEEDKAPLLGERGIAWIHENKPSVAVDHVREIFRTVLHHIQKQLKSKSRYVQDKEAVEGIKNIMFLTGEAARKLETYMRIYKDGDEGIVSRLPEFRKLQEFYQKKIEKKIDTGTLGSWVLGLAQDTMMRDVAKEVRKRKVTSLKHEVIDLEAIRSDREYELLMMRRADGTLFYDLELIRNMRLVCDFGGNLEEEQWSDLLRRIAVWREETYQRAARSILNRSWETMVSFYRSTMKHKNSPLIQLTNKVAMALMMSANPHNVTSDLIKKNTGDYFRDFHLFLREILKSREYQKFVLYPEEKRLKTEIAVFRLIQNFCRGLFTSNHSYLSFHYHIDDVIHQARQRAESRISVEPSMSKTIWGRLAHDYASVMHALEFHRNGPLMRTLDHLQWDQGYDPFIQDNLPGVYYDLLFDDRKVSFYHLPTPMIQKNVEGVEILDEFKNFLLSNHSAEGCTEHLLVNLNPRHDWVGHARAQALETLQKSSLFKDVLTTVSIPFDNSFAVQRGTEGKSIDRTEFIDNLSEFVKSNHKGYYLPEKMQKMCSRDWIKSLLETLVELFYGDKENLDHIQRVNIITLFNLCLVLYWIDQMPVTSVSFTSKDGLDASSIMGACFYLFIHMINRETLSEMSIEQLNVMLYAPSMITRERCILPVAFERLIATIREWEEVRSSQRPQQFIEQAHKKLEKHFSSSLLRAFTESPS